MQQVGWHGSKLSNRQKRATQLHNLALFLTPEAHIATASEHSHFTDKEIFLKQQFQTSSCEKILRSEKVEDILCQKKAIFKR